MSEPHTLPSKWSDPRLQAAIAYAVYGVVYMVGAILEMDDGRIRPFRFGIPWWFYFALGGIFMVTFPPLIFRGIRWLIWGLCLFTAFKAFWLCWLQGRGISRGEPIDPYRLFFVVVAMVASSLLFRAAVTARRR